MKDALKDKNFWILTIIAGLLLVTSNIIVKYSFELFNASIQMSVLTYPVIFFFINWIVKKYGAKPSLLAVIFTIIIQLLVYFFTQTSIASIVIIGSLIAYIISIVTDIYLYNYIIKDDDGFFKYFLIFFVYVITLILDMVIFSMIIKTEFSTNVLIVNIVRFGVALILVIIDALISFKSNKNKTVT